MTTRAKLRELEQRVATLKRTKLPGGSETKVLLSELMAELREAVREQGEKEDSKKEKPASWEPDTLNEGESK